MSCLRFRSTLPLVCAALFLLVFRLPVALADDAYWEGQIGGVGPDYVIQVPHADADPFKGNVHVTVTNTGNQPWGDFHFQIYDPLGGQDISNVHFLDASLGGEDPTSSQAPLAWVIDNEIVGATIDLYFYADPVMPGETAWFQVYTDNPDHVPFFGVMFYPTPVPTRACCFEGGLCQVLPADQCIAAGGEVYPEATCEPNPCPPPLFACCLPNDEACYMMTGVDCEAAGGVWYVDAICSWAGGTFDCPLWRVCCVGYVCYIVTEETCVSMQGEWHPGWTTCEPNPCEPPSPADPDSWGTIKSIYR